MKSIMQDIVYFDNASTTPLAPEVVKVMHQALLHTVPSWANTNSNHRLGRAAKQEIMQSQEMIAQFFNCDVASIIFTSGATESINQALKGVMGLQKSKKHMITTTIEHKATLQVAQSLMQKGIKVTFLKPNQNAQVTLDMIKAEITPETALVSLIWLNNETGTIFEIERISEYLRANKILLHVDATQAASRIKIDASKIDLLSMSAHKCYGPKGIGLLLRANFPKINLKPLIEGSDAQMGVRAGTLPNHQIIGLAQALNQITRNRDDQIMKNIAMHDFVLEQLVDLKIKLNGGSKAHPSIMNIYIPNVLSETLIYLLPNVCFSVGSACSSENYAPSHVLTELGLTPLNARQSIRLSFGQFTTDIALKKGITRIKLAAAHLQMLSEGKPSHLTLLPLNLYWPDFDNKLLISTLLDPKLIQYNEGESNELGEFLDIVRNSDEYEIALRATHNNDRVMLNARVCGCPYAIVFISLLLQEIRLLNFREYCELDVKARLRDMAEKLDFPPHKLRLLVTLEDIFAELKESVKAIEPIKRPTWAK